MKKFLTILLCIALSISTLAFTACNGGMSAEFEGDYQTASKTEVEALVGEIAFNSASQGINWEHGFSVDFTLSGDLGGGDVNVKFNYDVKLVDQILTAAGFIDMSDVASTVKGNFYFVDDYQYINGSIGVVGVATNHGKFKTQTTYSDMLTEYGISSVIMDDLYTSLPYVAASGSVWNFYVEDTETGMKIKLDSPRQTVTVGSGEYTRVVDGKGTYVWVYDADYNLTAFYADMMSNATTNSPEGTSYTRISATLSITPFAGEIKLPADLDSYIGL